MQTRKGTQSNFSSDFGLIYEAAKAGNIPALDGLLNGNINVDVRDHLGLFTPAAKLAAEGNDSAVNLLAAVGANNDFIAMGYASTGKIEKADNLRKTKGISLKYLAIGAAMHEDHAYAEKLRAQYELYPSWFVYGATLAGHHDYVSTLENRLHDHQKPGTPVLIGELKLKEQIACAKIKGLVMGGCIDQAIKMLVSQNCNEADLLLRVAIKAAARSANEAALEKLIYLKGNDPYLLNYYFELAAVGAAKGGHIEYARALLSKTNEQSRKNPGYHSSPRNEQTMAVVKAGLIYGHFNEIFKYFSDLLKVDRKYFLSPDVTLSAFVKKYGELAELSALHGNLHLPEKLFHESQFASLTNIVKAMDLSGHYYNHKMLIYALSFVNNQDFLQALTTAAVELGSDPEALKSLKTHSQGWTSMFEHQCFAEFYQYQKMAMKVNHLMRKYHFNYDQAEAFLVSQELRSVLGFVAFKGGPLLRAMPSLLSDHLGLSTVDLHDMAEKYMLYMMKTMVDKELGAYLDRNFLSYFQHYNRVKSLRQACSQAGSRDELKDRINFQHRLLKGDIIMPKNTSRPKHEQQLKNPASTDDDCYKTIENLSNHPRLKN